MSDQAKASSSTAAPVPAAAPAPAAVVAALENELHALRLEVAQKEAQLAQAGGGPQLSKKAKKKSAANKIETDPVQGCRDFAPEEMRMRNYLFDTFHATAKKFGFENYDAPVLESEELYVRKAGEEITEQMFNFVTKGGHRVALRPEMTPTLARLVLAKGKALNLPVKWYSIPQCWRYETITRGRKREHYQWNMDIVGVKSSTAEAELICAFASCMEAFGFTAADVGVKVNSRKILQTVIEKAGVPKDKFAPVCIIVDKMEKLPREEIVEMLAKEELSGDMIDEIQNALSLKSIDDVARVVGEDHEAVAELRLFFDTINAYGYGDWVQLDASVVRGLAYYTGIVFEGFDRAGELRAIFGGGRYDGLMTTYGASQPVPCCGFGFGDCVLMELLAEKKLLPKLSQQMDDVVIPFDESMRPHAVAILRKLRDAGRNADIVLDKKKLAQAFTYADRVGAERAVLLAPDEWAQGKLKVKNLRVGAGKADGGKGDSGDVMTVEELLAKKD